MRLSIRLLLTRSVRRTLRASPAGRCSKLSWRTCTTRGPRAAADPPGPAPRAPPQKAPPPSQALLPGSLRCHLPATQWRMRPRRRPVAICTYTCPRPPRCPRRASRLGHARAQRQLATPPPPPPRTRASSRPLQRRRRGRLALHPRLLLVDLPAAMASSAVCRPPRRTGGVGRRRRRRRRRVGRGTSRSVSLRRTPPPTPLQRHRRWRRRRRRPSVAPSRTRSRKRARRRRRRQRRMRRLLSQMMRPKKSCPQGRRRSRRSRRSCRSRSILCSLH